MKAAEADRRSGGGSVETEKVRQEEEGQEQKQVLTGELQTTPKRKAISFLCRKLMNRRPTGLHWGGINKMSIDGRW